MSEKHLPVPPFLGEHLELQRLVWDEPHRALAAIEKLRGNGEQLHPPLLADFEVRARLRSSEDLARAETVAREVAAHRNDASAHELLAEVLEALGKGTEAAESRKRASTLPNKMMTGEVRAPIDDLGFMKKRK